MWKRSRRWLSRWTGSYPLTLDGTFFDCDAEHAPFWYQMDRGRWEPETLRVLDALLTPDACYWDVGAWIGPTVLYASGRCRKVVAFEPDPVAFATLQRNVQKNKLTHVQLQPAAVGPTSGTLKLAPPHGAGLGTSVTSVLFADAAAGDAISAEVHHPDTWIAAKGLPAPTAMKIDIEGAEFQLLPQLADFFRQRQPSVYLSLHAPWTTNPAAALKSLLPALQVFPYCYDAALEQQSVGDVLSADQTRTGFTSLVLSFRELGVNRAHIRHAA